MTIPVNLPDVSRQSSADLLIVGGGIMGLWAAYFAGRQGLRVVLAERGEIGSGASGGLLGSLLSYMPDRWDRKKQLQLDALVSLEPEVANLEALTGFKTGYRRCGRLIPLPQPHLRAIAEGHEQDALCNWVKDGRPFYWRVLDAAPQSLGLSGDVAGYVHDTLAARVSPRGLVQALKSALKTMDTVELREGCAVDHIDPFSGTASLTGQKLAFGHCIIANGWESFPLLAFDTHLTRPLGQPVKGQSALLSASLDPDLPVVFFDGLYIVPHDNGTVAIGSTSENSFAEPFSTDAQLDALIAQARALMPQLAEAEVIERWAGLRPKATQRDPMIGPHPLYPNILALTGGFKISFGLAHHLATLVVGMVEGQEPVGLPQSFSFSSHWAKATITA